MWHCPQGLHAFLRAYYHIKSADWTDNQPFRSQAGRADELAKMPSYYIMDRDKGMAETVAPDMPTPAQIAACRGCTDAELAVYTAEYGRTGFQGGLQWYRCAHAAAVSSPSCRSSPAARSTCRRCFIAGKSDWGVYQGPASCERCRSACTRMRRLPPGRRRRPLGAAGAAGRRPRGCCSTSSSVTHRRRPRRQDPARRLLPTIKASSAPRIGSPA